jgi:hypothetical protein
MNVFQRPRLKEMAGRLLRMHQRLRSKVTKEVTPAVQIWRKPLVKEHLLFSGKKEPRDKHKGQGKKNCG